MSNTEQIKTYVAVAISLAVLVFFGLYLYRSVFHPELRHMPGPWLARLSPFWRLWFVWDGTGHDGYQRLHKRYGRIVRTAPNVIDISDPAAIPTIYGISSKFMKVIIRSNSAGRCEANDVLRSRRFTAVSPCYTKTSSWRTCSRRETRRNTGI
jgi:hypothetical protein